jgi:cyclopropane fatty-acyl-phospholipid synthase-like methyltransferase
VSDPKRIVEAGYDALAPRFGAWRAAIGGSPDEEWVGALLAELPAGGRILELGCGDGEPVGRLLAGRFDYTGVDLSREQLARAAASIPAGRFIHADYTTLDLEPGSLPAVVAIYTFNHVPRAELPPLLGRIHEWLAPGGVLLASFGRSGGEGVEHDWLGVPMFFGSYTDAETRELITDGGFRIERDEVVPIQEPEGEASFLWVLARAQGRAARSA